MKKTLALLLALTMVFALCACGQSSAPAAATAAPAAPAAEAKPHIGIITGSVSQSEDDRRGAEAFQAKYGEDMVKLAIYPDNFTEELETTIQTIVNLSDDPQMKAIIVNQGVPGTAEAFRQIKEKRPDILCIAGEAHEDLPEIGSAADLVCNNDFVARGYRDLTGTEGKIDATHGGLECGIFIEKIPGLDAISLGPELHDVHSVRERLSVPSTERVYELVCEVLRRSR